MNIHSTSTRNHRARWAAIGAAVAVSLGAGGIGLVQATSPDGASAYVPITPCRLADTRPAPDNVGARANALGPAESHTFNGWASAGGTGNCTDAELPDGTTGLELNVTAVGASQITNLRLWPTGESMPLSSNLNPAVGQSATPNSVTVALSSTGQFNIFNFQGDVHVVIDVVGHYTDHNHDDRYYVKDDVYTKAEVDELLAANGQGVEWINVRSDATIRSMSPGFEGATVERPASAPVGHYCIHVPSGHGMSFESAVASVQTGGTQPRTASPTTTFGNTCNSTGSWFVAVETYTGDTKTNNAFMVFVPRN